MRTLGGGGTRITAGHALGGWTSDFDLNIVCAVAAEHVDAVTFSDLSRNPRGVAERARRLGRLRVTHRDAADFYLTAADREEERDENLVTASRMFAALSRSESGARAVESALADVFPWVRHLSAAERSEFSRELVAALSDAAELTIDANAHEVVAAWRATARIKADKSQYAQALADQGRSRACRGSRLSPAAATVSPSLLLRVNGMSGSARATRPPAGKNCAVTP